MPSQDCQTLSSLSQEREMNPSLYEPLYFDFSVKCIPFISPFSVQVHPPEGLLCAEHLTRHPHVSVPSNPLELISHL